MKVLALVDDFLHDNWYLSVFFLSSLRVILCLPSRPEVFVRYLSHGDAPILLQSNYAF